MTAAVKNQLCGWALTALQMTHDNLDTNPLVKCICNTLDKSLNGVPPSNKQQQQSSSTAEGSENVRPVITRSEVRNHCDFDSCWIVINNRVYDVTRFLRMHPGGEDIILECAGCDATSVFIDKGHSGDAYEMLKEYFIGDIAPADRLPERQTR